MRNSIILFIFSFLMPFTYVQSQTVIDTSDYAERKLFINSFKASNEHFIKNVKEQYSGKVAKTLASNYKEFESEFIQEIEDKNFTFKSGLEQYVLEIINDLRKNNANIPKNIDVLIGKSNFPNAYCLANDTFVVNMGLFNWIENRDQLMSVIAHELGHNLLHHVLNGQVKLITENLRESTVVKNLKTQTNNRTAKAFELLKGKIYAQKALKRKHEMEADSIGYVLFKNTSAHSFEYVNAFKMLLEFDTISPLKLNKDTFIRLYDLPNQKFNEKWLEAEDFTAYNYDAYKQKLNADSLASHPETLERILKLKNIFTELTIEKQPQKADEKFIQMKKLAKTEILPNLFATEKYGVGVYAAMQFLQEKEEGDESQQLFYKKWLGKCFEKIHEARQNYQLNRYLDSIDPKNQSESYQQFLNFMWNLKIEEIKTIADFYAI